VNPRTDERSQDAVSSPARGAAPVVRVVTFLAMLGGVLKAASHKTPAATGQERRPTYASRLDDLRIFSTRAAWLAGGVVGLIALSAGDLGAEFFKKGPDWLGGVTLTLIVLAGGFAGTARVQFQWQATVLARRIDEGAVDGRSTVPRGSWPRAADRTFKLAFLFTILGGCSFVTHLWIVALS
jgi:hypothetical protein